MKVPLAVLAAWSAVLLASPAAAAAGGNKGTKGADKAKPAPGGGQPSGQQSSDGNGNGKPPHGGKSKKILSSDAVVPGPSPEPATTDQRPADWGDGAGAVRPDDPAADEEVEESTSAAEMEDVAITVEGLIAQQEFLSSIAVDGANLTESSMYLLPSREEEVMAETLPNGKLPGRPDRKTGRVKASSSDPSSDGGAGPGNSGGAPGQKKKDPNDDAEEELRRRRRSLLAATSSIGTFAPLDCNADLAAQACSGSAASLVAGGGDGLVVPCGQCYTYDLGADVTLAGGIDVRGKLVFPPGYKATIYTSFVLVQGELEIVNDAATVAPENESVRFVLTGTADRTFVPAGPPNQAACSSHAGGACPMGRKPFVVAGGRLNVRGLPDGARTWTRVRSVAKGQVKRLDGTQFDLQVAPPSPECPAAAVDVDFLDGFEGWTGGDGAVCSGADGHSSALTVSDRRRSWQGPRLDYTQIARNCLVPDQDYLLTVRLKVDRADGTGAGTPTTCSADGTGCAKLVSAVLGPADNGIWHNKGGQHRATAGNYGEYVRMTSVVRWDGAEMDPANVYYFWRLEGPPPGVDITVDSFRLSLPGPASYPDPANACGELLMNGDAEAPDFHPYPWKSNNWEADLVVLEEGSNKFFRMAGRKAHWVSPEIDLNTNCFSPGYVYRASQKVRIHSDVGVSYYALLFGHGQDGSYWEKRIAECPKQGSADGWVACGADFVMDATMRDAGWMRFKIVPEDTAGGRTADVDYDDLSISFGEGPVEGLLVDSAAVRHWGAGSDIHVTSSTFSSDDGQESAISSVVDRGDGTAVLGLEDDLNSVLSEDDSPDFAVEIGLLSRNVRIEGADDEEGQGGYLQVVHTPNVAQVIDGVEFRNMGQRSVANRFPVQFLYSREVAGTVVSRNAIRRSNQRCICLDGTSDVVVSENVAFDTSGHCYFVGFESERNRFERNLGSKINDGIHWSNRIPGDRDDEGSTFFSYYPPNDFVGNVAAGSKRAHGFFLHNWWYTRNEDGGNANIGNPRRLQMGVFKDNVAHSNHRAGLGFYDHEQELDGFGPTIIESFKSYRNKGHGAYIQAVQCPMINGGVFADNRVAIELALSDDAHVHNTDVRGLTGLTKEATKTAGWKLCPGQGLIGLKIPSTVYRDWYQKRGSLLANTTFTGFDDNKEECPGSISVSFLDWNKRDGHFAYASSFEGGEFTDSGLMDACQAESWGVKDVKIDDVDGSSNPTGNPSGHSTIVSNQDYMKEFVSSSCTEYANMCLAYCENTCMRTVSFVTEYDGTKDMTLRVTDNVSGKAILVSGSFEMYNGDDSSFDFHYRTFSATLPSGSFTAEFLDINGNVTWPGWVEQKWEDAPSCADYPNAADVTLVEPIPDAASCNNFVLNGGIDNGSHLHWRHNIWGGAVSVVPGAGIGGSDAVTTVNRNGGWHIIGGHLDSRCLSASHGKYVEFKGWFRLDDNGVSADCDPNTRHEHLGACPKVSFKTTGYNDLNKESMWTHWRGFGNNRVYAVMPYNKDSFNLFHGIFKVDDYYASVNRLFFYVERYANTNANFVIDDFSVTPFDPGCEEFVMNGNFDEGNTMFWQKWGEPSLEMVEGSGGQGDHALKATSRNHWSWGPKQMLNLDCLAPGDRIAVTARYKLEKDGQVFHCNPATWDQETRCSDILMYARKSGFSDTWARIADTVATTTDADGWMTLAGIHKMTEGHTNADETNLFFDGAYNNKDITVDDVSVKHLPMNCNELILNPSFDDGTTSFWLSEHRYGDMDLVAGAGGSGYAMRQYNRRYAWHGIVQDLDTRCLVEGVEYQISAKFRLLNSTGHGVMCDTSVTWDSNVQCPSVKLQAWDCDSPEHMWQQYWNDIPFFNWDPDAFNDFRATFIVDANLASCKNLRLHLRDINIEKDIVVDDFQISIPTTPEPTAYPTPSPVVDESTPTATPTTGTIAPTASAQGCPPVGETTTIDAGATFLLHSPDLLCTLSKADVDNAGNVTSVIPIVKSYSGNPWEIEQGAGLLLGGQTLTCYDNGCQVTLPPLGTGEQYHLKTYPDTNPTQARMRTRRMLTHTLTEKDQVARFLESSTFGATTVDLENWNYNASLNDAMATWIEDQMEASTAGITSHRKFYRQRANARFPTPRNVAKADHPCDPLSRWRSFTFTRKDNTHWKEEMLSFAALGANSSAPYSVILDGHVRTVVQDMNFANNNYVMDYTRTYEMCWSPQERLDGLVYVHVEDGSCQALRNPAVDFTNHETLATNALHFSNLDDLQPIDAAVTDGAELILPNGSNDPVCNGIPDIVEDGDAPVFGRLPDGKWVQFDPRIVLEENTVDAPVGDGGGSTELATAGETLCANAPRTFLNEDGCTLSSLASTCGAASAPETQILLNDDNIRQLHNITGRYVYSIEGLATTDLFGNKVVHPCTNGVRSRWELRDVESCNPTPLDSDTNQTLFDLLLNSNDLNPFIRDITVNEAIEGVQCGNETQNDPEVEIIVGGTCFKHVHPDHMSVYDMTFWTEDMSHPGNMEAANHGHPNPIKKWMDLEGSATLTFPSLHPTYTHPMTRWDANKQYFDYIGRYGDSVRFRDLTNELRFNEVAQAFGATGSNGGTGILVCGSPDEVANEPALGSNFDVATGWDTNWELDQQREIVWVMVALSAQDQLRQRVAWALSQILVVVKSAISSEGRNTEAFLAYYDIFVKHAFGSYRDVLREIAYSPLMAENLSYLQSKSAAYIMEHQNKVSFADENFAREIMQLFTIGLVELNIDGTPKLDINGNEILTYTNDAIMSIARAWTGFDLQQKRGNVEEVEWSGNRVDPMRIEAPWRDRFPKSDLSGGYIGDGYPLCADLPERMFLRSGALYRLLGSSSSPELMEDPQEFADDPTVKRLELDANSALRNLLCNSGTSGNCEFANSVVVTTNLPCTGVECDVDTVRVVEVSGMWYEYVRPACVEQAFFNNAVKVSRRHKSWPTTCGNPLLPVASDACCMSGSMDGVTDPKYDRERVTYDTAKQRCSAMSRMTCDFNHVVRTENHADYKTGYHWAKNPCLIRVKVDAAGQAAIVYEPDQYTEKERHIDDLSLNFFKVYWTDNQYPNTGNSCADSSCQTLPDGGCLCNTVVRESRVFAAMPGSTKDVMEKLYIGAIDPSAFDSDTYSATLDATTGITAYTIDGNYNTKTIFEVTDSRTGRTHFLKNAHETVEIQSQGSSIMSFRNAPHFMSMIFAETSVRDAQFETEATLDHFFYHKNTPPFVAIRLIQRLVTSNPGPRYVEQVATAFQTGLYQAGDKTFGSGSYGDLSASIAAVFLDREARDVRLDVDPAHGLLREPLLKVIGVMRSMEFASVSSEPLVRLRDMERSIGQMAHELPSVFSFFLPEFIPSEGRLSHASLLSPEAMLLDMPKTVNLLNGLFSMVKYGLSDCYNGFGHWADYHTGGCGEGQYGKANGILEYKPTSTSSADIVDELACLLTAGRLSAANRDVVQSAYDAAPNADAGLRIAQQLIMTTPEFHSTNVVDMATDQNRDPPVMPTPSTKPYKAVVYLMFSGGCDSFNMLVPHTCSGKDLYAEYSMVREQVALLKQNLLEIDASASNQTCETFGVHNALPVLQGLYNDGDLLFFANTGVLTMPVTKDDYWLYTETQLFAHNHMQREAMRVDPLEEASNTGVLGRMTDILKRKGSTVGSFSIDRSAVALTGQPGQSPSAFILSQHGINEFNPAPSMGNMMDQITAMNEATNADSGFFAEMWSDHLLRSLANNDLLHTTLEDLTTNQTFPATDLGRKLRIVSQMIATRAQRGVDRDAFFVEVGGFDTHADVGENLRNRFNEVNGAIASFAAELKSMGVWNEVTTIQTSDFARTLAPNSGDGTDHAWGGNYIMFGGAVKGGQIVGHYPDDLTDDGPLGLGRGRLIPTTSWDACFQAVAEWAGVDAADMNEVCPNRGQFPAEQLFTAADLFVDPAPAATARKRFLRK